MKSGVNPTKSSLQTPRVMSAVKVGGIKACPESLARVIVLANLAGDQQLPDIRFTDFRGDRNNPSIPHIPLAEYLPDPVRLNLLEVMTNPQAWEMTPEEWATGWTVKPSIEQARYFLQASALAERYALIRGTREALTAIVAGDRTVPVTTFLKRGPDGKGEYARDLISDALLEAEWDYIKRCPICGKFFYAQRITQDAWPLACAKALRARRKRTSDKLKRELAKKKTKQRGK